MKFENLDIHNINAGDINQLKILQPHFSFVQNSFITEIIHQTKKNSNAIVKPLVFKPRSPYKSFQNSVHLSKLMLIKHVKKITEGDEPPIIRERNHYGDQYSVNLNYFQNLHPESGFDSVNSIWNSSKISQDRFFCFTYGWNQGRILSYILYLCNKDKKDTQRIIPSRSRKEIMMERTVFKRNLDALLSGNNSPIYNIRNPYNGVYEISLNKKKIKQIQLLTLEYLCNNKVIDFKKIEFKLEKGEQIDIPELTVKKNGIQTIID